MNQNHVNRGKAARIARTAAAVVQALKSQGVKITPTQEAAAINAIAAEAQAEPNSMLGEPK